jgi:hypothetical protein
MSQNETNNTPLKVEQKARQIAEETGALVVWIVVCPDHGATGPFKTPEEARYNADSLNDESTGCIYRALPMFIADPRLPL